MQDSTVILMSKNKETGVLEKELCTLSLYENAYFLSNIFAVQEEDGLCVHLFATCERDVLDWEFQAIYDYYDTDVFSGAEVMEKEDCDNPTWEIIFPYIEDENKLAAKVNSLLAAHASELSSVYAAIKGLEGEYDAL